MYTPVQSSVLDAYLTSCSNEMQLLAAYQEGMRRGYAMGSQEGFRRGFSHGRALIMPRGAGSDSEMDGCGYEP